MDNEIHYVEEIAPLTEEQWNRIINWARLRSPKLVRGVQAAKEFSNSMEKIQQMAGETSDSITTLRQQVTEFAESLDLPPFVHKLNELLNQRAWEQAAEEEKRAMQKIANMWEIVQAVATVESTRRELYSSDSWECPFCDGLSKLFSQDVEHNSDCIVTKARAMVKVVEQGE